MDQINHNTQSTRNSQQSVQENGNQQEKEFDDLWLNDLENQNGNKVKPNDFYIHGLIGKGSFGEVYLVEKKDTQ